MAMSPPELLVVAGEASGDLHGARLIAELKRRVPDLATFGLGGDEMRAAAVEEVGAAVREAEATPAPALESIFSDVYADLPAHLRRQGQAAFDLARRKGDAAAGTGEFPL